MLPDISFIELMIQTANTIKIEDILNDPESGKYVEYYESATFDSGSPLYKVRAYLLINGKHYYGPYSKSVALNPYSDNPNASDFSGIYPYGLPDK